MVKGKKLGTIQTFLHMMEYLGSNDPVIDPQLNGGVTAIEELFNGEVRIVIRGGDVLMKDIWTAKRVRNELDQYRYDSVVQIYFADTGSHAYLKVTEYNQ